MIIMDDDTASTNDNDMTLFQNMRVENGVFVSPGEYCCYPIDILLVYPSVLFQNVVCSRVFVISQEKN